MEDSGFNTFNNDGSFMEQFMKMQEEKKKKEEEASTPAPPAPSLLKKKPLLMKMRGLKKTPTLVKSTKTVSILEGNDTSDNNKETQKDKTKETEPVIPLASSIASRGMASGDGNQVSGTPTPQLAGKKRKRSRWSDAPPSDPPPSQSTVSSGGTTTSTDNDSLMASAMASFGEPSSSVGPQYGGQVAVSTGGQQLTQEQLLQVKEQIAMNKLVAEIRAATDRAVQSKKNNPNAPVVYEYDSDEDTEGGTWEHKIRAQEMLKTLEKARDLTEQGKGKHHIGDFLPPQELEKFIEKARAIKEGRNPDLSDYREHKLDESNIGFRLLQKSGWSEGEGLGEKQDGITAPINQGKQSFDQAGIGAEVPGEVTEEDDPFDTYRKRMMLAYRFRPNPLNNPRRPYY